MKNVLLAGTALLGVAFASAPASAELNLDLGGYFRGYAVYADQDGAPTGTNSFEFRRDAELHVNGETTLDNGLTVGFHTEQQLTESTGTDEVYAYFSGQWGRVNLGREDGAAYLLQVAAPSADSNVDGLRAYINGLNNFGKLDYANDPFRGEGKLTYLSPKFSGFQAGVSYTPKTDVDGVNTGGMSNLSDYENAYEASARWDGEFQGFGLSTGAGYTHASSDNAASGLESWNAGLNVAFNAFSVGVSYLNFEDSSIGADDDTWVFGAAWDNGPYHLGASYLTKDVASATGFDDADRITVGGGYTFGPGMTFRGAVAFGEDQGAGAGASGEDFTQVTVGTDIQF